MTEADLADGLRLSRASGWNQTGEDWRLLLSLGRGLFCAAVEKERVVASGGAVRYGAALAWICMILVDPARRGHGLGTRIFDEVLERVRHTAQREGLRVIGLDATPAGRGIYAQRGFQDGPPLVRMRVAASAPADPAGDVRALVAADLATILDWDRTVFGADRSAVLRWALERAPRLARVVRRDGRLRGYCFGRHGDHSDQLGPVVADDAATAQELVAACLLRSRLRPLVLDARVETAWLARLAGLGFREQRPFTRMYLGAARPAARPELEHAVCGPELG
jgi:GNAT superfamily N-acetyltransferase